jgi:hypothetical protein
MNKFKINILTIFLITTFSISPAEADLKTYGKEFFRISSESSQSESLNMVLDKFPILKSDNPCYKLTTPLIPEFTENDDTNWNIFKEFKLILEKWVSNSIVQIESSSSCFPKPTATNWEMEVNNLQSNFYTKLKSEVPTYCVEIPLTKPVFTGDSGKDGEIFNLWVKSTFDPWANQMITENRLKCGKSEPSNYVEICRSKVKEKSVALDPAFGAYNQYQALWKDKSKLEQLLKDKNWSIENAYKEYSSLISTEIVRLNKIWQLYDIDGNLKSICSQTTAEIYGEWTTIERYRTDLINSFNQLQEFISQIYSSYQETQQQNNSYDDPAVFYEQVDHYYLKYVSSQIDWLKSLGIMFSFLSAPPSKPVWTNTKDGSNAKLVNDFISAMSKWWSVEAPRMQEAYLEYNLKNVQIWSKNLQASWSEYVIRVALEKYGAGGTYKFVNSIPNPSQILISSPTATLMENFENELNDWATSEIRNLRIENYTPINNGEVEGQVKVCMAAIDRAKTYIGRFDSQIAYLKYTWADYNRLLEILKAKNTTLLMYRVQIDQQVQSPYLSDLYDVVLPLLAGVKANCGTTSQTLKVWTDTYQIVEKEILKLRDFLVTISNYYDKYRFTEPKLIPQIGKITQIVGGCRVEILNYDPTFKWYAKGSMVVDVNGIATIYNGSIDQYISTEKPGYQTVNFIEGLFKCPGIPTLSANTVDVQAPVMSLLNLSKSEFYKGESFNVSVLITDNREVNNFRISVVDQIGQTFPCYDGVAWKLRTQGDSNIGVYQVECFIRSVSYDGTWKISGSATDLNFNSASFELAKIKVLYGDAPETVRESNSASSSDKDSMPTRTIGTAQSVALIIKDNVKNEQEEALLLNVVQKISNLPKTTRSSSVNSLNSIKNQINIVVETPKICKYQNGIIRRVAKGICTTSIEIADSTGNKYLIAQQLRFR